jgi:hypothetical protein
MHSHEPATVRYANDNASVWPDGAWIACGTGAGVVLVSADGKEIYALGQVEGGKWRFGAIDFKSGAERTIYEFGPEVQFASAPILRSP